MNDDAREAVHVAEDVEGVIRGQGHVEEEQTRERGAGKPLDNLAGGLVDQGDVVR